MRRSFVEKKRVLGFFYFSAAVMVSAVVGITLGIIGKTVGNFQDFLRASKQEFYLYKRYPRRNDLRYMYKVMSVARSSNEPEKIKKIREDFMKKKRGAYHPLWACFVFFMVFFVVTPFSWLLGILEGPIRVFEEFLEFWQVKVLKEPYVELYERALQEQKNHVQK